MAGTDDAVVGAGEAEARDPTDADFAAALEELSGYAEEAREILARPDVSDEERVAARMAIAAEAVAHWIAVMTEWSEEVKEKHQALCVQVDGLIKDVGALEGRVLSLEESR